MNFLLCIPTVAMEDVTDNYIVFIGNPGSGKSALINALVNQHVAESGLSFTGLTTKMQKIVHEGITFIDTPGLKDTAIAEEAALEIEKSLKFGGNYKIFFVINIKAGRIILEDCDTINRVMKAINNGDKLYHIVINQVKRNERRKIFEDSLIYEKFRNNLERELLIKPFSITVIDFDLDHSSDMSEFINITVKERSFILKESKAFYLNSSQVAKVMTPAAEIRAQQQRQEQLQREYDEQIRREELRRELQQREEENARREREIDDLARFWVFILEDFLNKTLIH